MDPAVCSRLLSRASGAALVQCTWGSFEQRKKYTEGLYPSLQYNPAKASEIMVQALKQDINKKRAGRVWG